jgi:mono/diheme cytochrome c family protein
MAWPNRIIRRAPWMHSLVLAVLAVAFTLARARAEEGAAEKGERLYVEYCATCHGDDLQNNSGVAFDLRRLTADERPRFVNSVRHGKNAMPSWQGVLTSDQIDDLWAYIGERRYQK